MDFKPSTLRKCFIDRKIRGKTYPTAASLARDYEAEFGIKVNPRTIANDIASMRYDFNAPIQFDNDKNGYFYTDPAYYVEIFQNTAKDIPVGALGLGGLAVLGLKPDLFPLIPSSIFLPEWQKDVLKSLTGSLCPEKLRNAGTSGKISIVSVDAVQPVPAIAALGKALEGNLEVSLSFVSDNAAVHISLFRPFHRVCFTGFSSGGINRYVLGAAGNGNAPYMLINEDSLKTVDVSKIAFSPPKSIQIEAHGDDIVNIIISQNDFDTVLVFVNRHSKRKNAVPVYSLLTRMDIFQVSGGVVA